VGVLVARSKAWIYIPASKYLGIATVSPS
jgi:hypothetical protein